MASDFVAVENQRWAAAEQVCAITISGLKPSAFSKSVLGSVFLRNTGSCGRVHPSNDFNPGAA